MKSVQNIPIPSPQKGMQSNYSQYVADPSAWASLENFNNDRLGVLQTRPNTYFCDGDTASTQSIVPFRYGNNTSIFLAKVGTTVKSFASSIPQGAFNIETGIFTTATSLMRGSQVGGTMFLVSYGDNIKYTADGITFTTAPNLTTMNGSQNTLVQAGFVGRLWTTDGRSTSSNPGRLFYSAVFPVGAFPTVADLGLYVDLNSKGQPITAFADADNVLYCFTNYSIFRVYNTQSIDNSPFINIGAINQESVIKTPDAIFFMHNTGVYELKKGLITKISQDIDDFILSLTLPFNTNNFNQNVYGWFDSECAYWSVDLGDFYSGNFTDRNYVIRYNWVYKQWSIYSYQDVVFTAAATHSSSVNANNSFYNTVPTTLISADYIINAPASYTSVFGLSGAATRYSGEKPFGNGSVLGEPIGDWTIPNTDASSTSVSTSAFTRPINGNAVSEWITFGAENESKVISGISIASENAAGLVVEYQIDNQDKETSDRSDGKWNPVTTLTSDYVTYNRDWTSLPFNRLRLKVSGQVLGRPVTVGQIVFLTVVNNGYGNN